VLSVGAPQGILGSPPRDLDGAALFEAHLVAEVTPEAGDAAPSIDEPVDLVAHSPRPVLVVTDDHRAPVGAQHARLLGLLVEIVLGQKSRR
jgi:hypothetical protein